VAGAQATATVAQKAGSVGVKKMKKAHQLDKKNSDAGLKQTLQRSLSFRNRKFSKKEKALMDQDPSMLLIEEKQIQEQLFKEEQCLDFDTKVREIICEASAYDIEARDRIKILFHQYIVRDYVNGIIEGYKRGKRSFLSLFRKKVADESEKFRDEQQDIESRLRNITEAMEILKRLDRVSEN